MAKNATRLSIQPNIKKYLVPFCKFFTPLCPPLLAPLTLRFKNFNRVTFTTYYIKKAAANFALNRVLLMLNTYFCFNKKSYYRFVAFIFQTLKN